MPMLGLLSSPQMLPVTKYSFIQFQTKMEVGNYKFCANFDSGNLLKVEEVGCEAGDDCDAVFNIWASPDCYQTKYQVNTIIVLQIISLFSLSVRKHNIVVPFRFLRRKP